MNQPLSCRRHRRTAPPSPPCCRRAAASFSRRESPRGNPVIIIPASNASPEHDDDGASERQRGRESFLAKLLTALRISARETLATRGRARACQSKPTRTGTLACVLRHWGHSKLGVREPRIYEVTFLGAREVLLCSKLLQILSTNGTVSLTRRRTFNLFSLLLDTFS